MPVDKCQNLWITPRFDKCTKVCIVDNSQKLWITWIFILLYTIIYYILYVCIHVQYRLDKRMENLSFSFICLNAVKLSISLVAGEGELLGACPPYLVHITVRLDDAAVKLIDCDVSHKANRWLCNAERGAGSARYGSNRHCTGRGEPFRVAPVG